MEFLRAVKDKIVGIEHERKTVTDSGIIMGSPLGVGGALNYTVLAIGPDVKGVKVGDEIAVEWSNGTFFFHENKKHIVIQEKYVGAVVSE